MDAITNIHPSLTVFWSYQNDGRGIMKGSVQWKPEPEVIKLFSCSIELSMKFSSLINVKMPTFTFMSGRNSILDLSGLKQA